jgi:hypothetical protein
MTSELQQKILDAQTVHGNKPSEITYSFQSLADVMHHHRSFDKKIWMIYYDEYNNRTEISYSTFIEGTMMMHHICQRLERICDFRRFITVYCLCIKYFLL